MFEQDKIEQNNQTQDDPDLQNADLTSCDTELQEDLMTVNALPAHVEETIMYLVSAPDDEVLYDRIEELATAGTVRSAGSFSNLLIDGYHVILTDPSHFQNIRSQLQSMEARDVKITGRLIESSLSVDQETAFLVTRLPEGMQAATTMFGREAGAAVSENAIKKFCSELETLATHGVFETRAFDPTNWLYDTASETISLLKVTMPEVGEPETIRAKITAFKKDVL